MHSCVKQCESVSVNQ